MITWLNSIQTGILIYRSLAPVFFLPLALAAMIRSGRLNPVRLVLTQLFLLYLTVVLALVFLPLPSMEKAAGLTYQVQPIPFYFLVSFMKDPCAEGFLGVIFNIAMTVPFGMFLSYGLGFDVKKVVLFTFAFTCFIEIGQLTGLFFLYPGSYRICDLDDILQNTLGGYLGYRLVEQLGSLLPDLKRFDHEFRKERVGYVR